MSNERKQTAQRTVVDDIVLKRWGRRHVLEKTIMRLVPLRLQLRFTERSEIPTDEMGRNHLSRTAFSMTKT